ncbi:hypothetical protein E4U55_007165 [Claviceps digitariae]|nr:hypothetical protein E4U55_007165 [Claviceps digitariae]
MGLLDMLKKKKDEPATGGDEVLERKEATRKLDGAQADADADAVAANTAEFRFIRTDTASQEIIQPPDNGHGGNQNLLSPKPSVRSLRPSLDVFLSSRDRSGSVSSQTSHSSKRRLSERLHLSRSPGSSEHVPQNLPEITTTSTDPADQSQWEKRATMLVGQNLARTGSITITTSTTASSPRTGRIPASMSDGVSRMSLADDSSRPRSSSASPSLSPVAVSSKAIDEDIQEAIRLHEEGSLAESTKLFGRLADPQGANNPLSQVLYGLALR